MYELHLSIYSGILFIVASIIYSPLAMRSELDLCCTS